MGQRGRPPYPDVLTPAEWDVLQRIRHGLSNRQIARARGTGLDAVKGHVENIAGKLGVNGRPALRQWQGYPATSALATRRHALTTEIALGPLGQIAMQVADIDRAKAFYGDVLRLPHLFTFGPLAFYDCGGTRLLLNGMPEAANAGSSVLYFRVPDIEAAHAELRDRGVTFVAAPHLIHRHDDGTEEWMAFFADPDGHTLAIMSQV
jgi:DNA-binding CsgD family transcriptional regulator/catechol 2,3-dioxygenase-like lactoylglutathione lyase family enzyme